MVRSFHQWMQFTARFAVMLVLIGTVIVVAVNKIGPELAWPLAILQYIPSIFLLLPALAAVVISIKLGCKWRVISVCSLVVIVTVVMGLQLNAGERGGERIRLMTYNVKGYLAARGAEGMAPIAREIALHDADVIVLQDARELVAILVAKQAESHAILGDRQLYVYGQYVVASRHTLRDCGTGSIAFREQPHSYVRCVVDFNGHEIDLVTAHFLTPRDGLNAVRQEGLHGIGEWKQNVSDRMKQARELARDLRTSARPMIVAGDLNAPEQSLVVRTLLDIGIRDAFSAAGIGFGYTYGHSLWPGMSFVRIDHILVSPEIGVADCFVGGERASTHRAVVCDLLLGVPRS